MSDDADDGSSRTSLPPWAIDLLTDGLPPFVLKNRGRSEVDLAMRRVMVSAISAGWDSPDVHALFTQRGKRRRLLVEQIGQREGRTPDQPSTARPAAVEALGADREVARGAG